jgi:glycosyltransferase involved in cell wall biosynthesis
MPFSVAIITKDEEDRLPDCLESVSFADEIVVVDSGSRDNTISIAKSFGCKVLTETWRGYAKQKQFAVDSCTNDWVLILDSDERIPDETAREIRELLAPHERDFAACSFLRKNFFHNRWVRHCGWWPDRIVRLVDRRRGRFNNLLVHESWITEGSVKDLGVTIEHRSFRNYSDLIHKLETYSTLAAEEMLRDGKSAGTLSPLSHGIWMFLRTYILELGVLDGFDGFIISTLNGGGSFMKYAKLREARAFGHSLGKK